MNLTTPSSAHRAYCARFHGLHIYARSFGTYFEYPVSWAPGAGWRHHEYLSGAFSHPNFASVLVLPYSPTSTGILMRTQGRPNLPSLRARACSVLTTNAAPSHETVLPLTLRVPLMPNQRAAHLTASRPRRCEPVFPQLWDVEVIEGAEVAFRVTRTTTSAGTRYFAEGFLIGSMLSTRSFVYVADVSKLPLSSSPAFPPRFLSRAILGLFSFADGLEKAGLELDPGRRLPHLATVAVTKVDHRAADVWFDTRLQTAAGRKRIAVFAGPDCYRMSAHPRVAPVPVFL